MYIIEYQLLRATATLFRWRLSPVPKLNPEQKNIINSAFKDLMKRWKRVLQDFPESNRLSSPVDHLNRFVLILKDLKVFLARKDSKESHDLSKIPFKENYPEYFQRNYHYQTDGYFSIESAARYDHQIEFLFLGTAHIMRKVAYSMLAKHLKGNEKILEFGAGSGTSGDQFKQLFPYTQLDLLDPSHAYLEYAQQTYPGSFHKVIPGFIENFVSKEKYDLIFSCFIMHEIPVKYWDAAVTNIKLSLKPQGYLLIIDSQQNCDKPEHQFALDQFAEDFFEPYFEEFRQNSLEEYYEKQGFKLIAKEEVLFSKSLLFCLREQVS